jgi:hypothetical protein
MPGIYQWNGTPMMNRADRIASFTTQLETLRTLVRMHTNIGKQKNVRAGFASVAKELEDARKIERLTKGGRLFGLGIAMERTLRNSFQVLC